MVRSRVRASLSALAALTTVGALAACGSSPTTPAATTGAAASSAADVCAKGSLAVATPGRLTIGTDKPAYEPWFKNDDPGNGEGYESAVAYAIAAKLGFAKGEVAWVVAPFNAVVTPGKKKFDFDVNQVSISTERAKAVDFSSGYYDVRQAVVTYQGSPIAGKTAVADLSGAKLGAQVGTTSYQAIVTQIKPSVAPSVYDSNDLAVQALKNKQIDGIVADLPTAFYMSAAQLDNGVIVGQLPASGATPERFGAVLSKGSPLTTCVTRAVDALRADGTLARLVAAWLSSAGAPELT
ncbi:MAG TPA: ABC transporter substrate-binding protein [Candidatus Lustribacter sp.]|nr:ABC transporter substrate-binding protein [Candidatus Lustribacter sp.]